MIRKLRLKFIASALVSVLITLVLLMGAINIYNYRTIAHNADQILYILKENHGVFPDLDDPFGTMHKPDDYSKETRFESRYFMVEMDTDGSILMTNTSKIQAIGIAQVIRYAQKVYSSDEQSGYVNNYRYLQYHDGSTTCLLFLDCNRSLHNFYNFFITSIVVSLIGFILVAILIVLLSSRAVKPLVESYEKQKRFITDAGHEIKTPLSTIQADLTVLEMDGLQNEWTDDIKYQTKRLSKLTNDLIYLSKMEETPVDEMLEFPLSDVVSETAASFEARAITENKTVQTDIEKNITYKGDQAKIEQLVTILLDNACKYSNPNGKILLSLHRKSKGIQLMVYNTCDSIDKENINHFFDRFYRQDASHNSQTGGYGIGLSIAQAIVQAHKGKIVATTSDEKSLEIDVTL